MSTAMPQFLVTYLQPHCTTLYFYLFINSLCQPTAKSRSDFKWKPLEIIIRRVALVYQCYVVQPWCERLRCRVRAREAGQLTTPCTVLINSHSAAAALGPTLIGQSSREHRAPNTPLPTVTPHTFSRPFVTASF